MSNIITGDHEPGSDAVAEMIADLDRISHCEQGMTLIINIRDGFERSVRVETSYVEGSSYRRRSGIGRNLVDAVRDYNNENDGDE